MRKKLFLMCGAAGSGKSTYIRKHAARGTSAWVSRDAVRFKLVKETEPYFSKEDEVFKVWCINVADALTAFWTEEIWVDATHLTKASRAKTLTEIDKHLEFWHSSLKDYDIIPIVVKPELDVCLEQNSKREGREFVPETVIKKMYDSFEMPNGEEKYKYESVQMV